MKNVLSFVVFFFLGLSTTFAQSDAELSTQIIGKWNMVSMDFGGDVMTAEQLKTTLENEYLEDGTMKYDDMMSGKRKEGKWKIVDGKITNPDEAAAPSPKVIKLTADELVVEMVDGGTTIKINMERI